MPILSTRYRYCPATKICQMYYRSKYRTYRSSNLCANKIEPAAGTLPHFPFQMATPATNYDVRTNDHKYWYQEKCFHLKATTAHATRTTRMMTKARAASITNTMGSSSWSWFSLLWELRGLLANSEFCATTYFPKSMISTFADRAIVLWQRGLLAMKSAKGVKPPFNWSKHLNHVIFSFYTFTFNVFCVA